MIIIKVHTDITTCDGDNILGFTDLYIDEKTIYAFSISEGVNVITQKRELTFWAGGTSFICDYKKSLAEELEKIINGNNKTKVSGIRSLPVILRQGNRRYLNKMGFKKG